MMKKIYTLFLGVSSLAWSTGTVIDEMENKHPNHRHEAISSFPEKDESTNKEKQMLGYDTRTQEEIEKRIDFLEGELAEYQSFNQQHHEIIKQLMEKKFFEKSFPNGNTEVLKILESVFTNNYGKGGPWGYIVSELYRRPQKFIKELEALRRDIESLSSEKNTDIQNLLIQIDEVLRIPYRMIVYYWNNTP